MAAEVCRNLQVRRWEGEGGVRWEGEGTAVKEG